MPVPEPHDFQMRAVPILRLADLRSEIERAHEQGLVDEGVYAEGLSWFVFEPPADMPDARSLIVAASRDPVTRFHFERRGTRVPVIVPPTYLRGREKDARTAEALSSAPPGERARRVARASIPTKLLAVRSGLARYGRNNITYVDGMGSFHRLVSFYSDAPCEEGVWREPEAMPECEGCALCRRGCPSGAIEPDRFLLSAERCITFWNEKSGEVPFPDWMESSWHNCLVGCMRCQWVCPANRGALDLCEEGGDFSEEETALLLRGAAESDLPGPLLEKLKRWDLLALLGHLPRNLAAVLDGRA